MIKLKKIPTILKRLIQAMNKTIEFNKYK